MINIFSELVNNCSQGAVATGEDPKKCLTDFPQVAAGKSQFQTTLSIIFGILAAVAIIIIILAAINMAYAGGDSERVAKARKSIIYALVGLIIALSAELIVLTLLGRL